MGGSTTKDITKAVGGVASDGVKVASGGTVDLEKKKVSFNPSTMTENVVSGVTGSSTIKNAQAMATPDIKMPKSQDASADAKRAAEEAKKKTGDLEKGGVASTILGGSLGDNSNVLKKKLLGE